MLLVQAQCNTVHQQDGQKWCLSPKEAQDFKKCQSCWDAHSSNTLEDAIEGAVIGQAGSALCSKIKHRKVKKRCQAGMIVAGTLSNLLSGRSKARVAHRHYCESICVAPLHKCTGSERCGH